MKKMRRFINLTLAAVLAAGLGMTATPAYASEEGEAVMYDPEFVRQLEDAGEGITGSAGETEEDGESVARLTAVPEVLAEDQLGSMSDLKNVVFCESANGVYFVMGGYNVVFYSLGDKTYTTVYSVENAEYTYSDDTGAYFFHTSSKVSWNKETQSREYEYTYVLYKYIFATGESAEITLQMPENISRYGFSCIGVDGKGRIYVASGSKDMLYLFNADGSFLSSTAYTGVIRNFYGFDDTNGNFYYRGSYNWVYWGYNHDMASLMAGNVDSGNVVHVKEGNIIQLFQSSWYEHEHAAAMVNGKYLAALSTFSANTCVLLDSNNYDYTDVTEQSTTITLVTNGVSVSLVNVSNENVIAAAVTTASSDYGSDEEGTDESSIGPRCDVNQAGTSLIAKTDTNVLTEYDIGTGEEKIQAQTTYPVYAFGMEGDTCVVLEKENDSYYIESFEWVYPETFDVSANESLTVGETAAITCSSVNEMLLDYTYESSDPGVASVDAKGQIYAWKKGTTTITVKAVQTGVSKSFTVTVADSALSKSGSTYKVVEAVGTTSANMHVSAADGGSYYSLVQNSYLTRLDNGHFERVEYVKGKIVREEYDSSYKLLSVKYIERELKYFGGFYSGETYNYLVFGQANKKESDKKEVIRVVKYSKSWKRLAACSIMGANTYVPFDAGGLDMTETGGKLYVYTCHTMYNEGDGLHHQSNCTFVVNESDMSLADSYYDVMNLSYGYVSHSFAQEIETDGTYIYRADLGDGYPRGIAFTMTKVEDAIKSPCRYGTLIKISGSTGANYTGYTLSDMKLSTNNYLVAGIGLKSSDATAANVYFCTGGKTASSASTIWLTGYKSSSKKQVYSPKIVKLSDAQFLVMWEEKNLTTGKYKTRMVLVGEDGTKASKIYSVPLALSECDPVVTKAGKVVWYVTNNGSPVFVEVNPYNLEQVETAAKKEAAFKTDNTGDFTNKKKTGYSAGDVVISKGRIFKLTSSKTVSLCGVTGEKTKITVPKTVNISGKTYKVTEIGQGAFKNQKKLKKVVIGSNVKTIGAYAFYRCKTLSSVSFGKNVTTIGEYSFCACTSLKSVTIPAKVSKIGESAFAKCKKLKSIAIKTSKLSSGNVGAAAMKGISSKAVIRVPAKKLSAYEKLFLKKGATKKMTFKKLKTTKEKSS